MASVNVPWIDKPVDVPDDLTDEELGQVNTALQQHPNYKGYKSTQDWKNLGEGVKNFAGSAVTHMPFNIGDTASQKLPPAYGGQPYNISENPEIKGWQSEHPGLDIASDFAGKTLGAVPAGMAMAAGPEGAVGLGAEAGGWTLYNYLDKGVSEGRWGPDAAKEAFEEGVTGTALGRFLGKLRTPNPVNKAPIPKAPTPVEAPVFKPPTPTEITTPSPTDFSPRQGYTSSELKGMGANPAAKGMQTPTETQKQLQDLLNERKTANAVDDYNKTLAKTNEINTQQQTGHMADVLNIKNANMEKVNNIPVPETSPGWKLAKFIGSALGAKLGLGMGTGNAIEAGLGIMLANPTSKGLSKAGSSYWRNQYMQEHPNVKAILKAMTQAGSQQVNRGTMGLSGLGQAAGIIPSP